MLLNEMHFEQVKRDRERELVRVDPALVDLDDVARHAVAGVQARRHRDEAHDDLIAVEHGA